MNLRSETPWPRPLTGENLCNPDLLNAVTVSLSRLERAMYPSAAAVRFA
jgi:hypothetical protein